MIRGEVELRPRKDVALVKELVDNGIEKRKFKKSIEKDIFFSECLSLTFSLSV